MDQFDAERVTAIRQLFEWSMSLFFLSPIALSREFMSTVCARPRVCVCMTVSLCGNENITVNRLNADNCLSNAKRQHFPAHLNWIKTQSTPSNKDDCCFRAICEWNWYRARASLELKHFSPLNRSNNKFTLFFLLCTQMNGRDGRGFHCLTLFYKQREAVCAKKTFDFHVSSDKSIALNSFHQLQYSQDRVFHSIIWMEFRVSCCSSAVILQQIVAYFYILWRIPRFWWKSIF